MIVIGNVYRRYVSSHEFFSKRAHLGYAAIAEEAIPYLPTDVQESMVPVDIKQTVFIYVAGTA